MQLYYFKGDVVNFGDDINPWFWSRILPDFFDGDASTVFVGIGTLINHRLPVGSKKIVMGSGYGYGQAPSVDGSWEFFAVRGPLTAKALGIEASLGIVDPAAKLPQFYSPSGRERARVSFMPHVSTHRTGLWSEACELAGINYIDPTSDCFDTIEKITGSDKLITEAMHGAIVADAYGVPWLAVGSGGEFFDFKWRDWGASLNLDVMIHELPELHKGEAEVPLMPAMKAKIKRALLGLNFWRDDWAAPLPRQSSSKEVSLAAKALGELDRSGFTQLSDRCTLGKNIARLDAAIGRFQEKYVA